MKTTIMTNTPVSGPSVAEEIHDEEQERELRQGEEEIGDPHERVVHRAAGLARDGADGGAHRDGHEHGGDTDGERNAATVEHAREQVLPEVVRAHRVRPRRRLELRLEVDLVDRHAVDQGAREDGKHHDGEGGRAEGGEAVPAEAAPRVGRERLGWAPPHHERAVEHRLRHRPVRHDGYRKEIRGSSQP
jgi:hypothetical protein